MVASNLRLLTDLLLWVSFTDRVMETDERMQLMQMGRIGAASCSTPEIDLYCHISVQV